MKRWRDVIYIPSESKDVSLLTCDVNCLTSVKLFNLTHAQLKEKIRTYREKPAWRRWLQRCFSSIKQQDEALSYYENCLRVRNQYFSEQNLALETSAIAEPPNNTQPLVVTSVSMAQNKQTTDIELIKKLKELEQLTKRVGEKSTALQEQQEQIRYEQRQSKENCSLTQESNTQESRVRPSP